MNRLFPLCILVFIIVLACDKKDNNTRNDDISILGTWNETLIKRFDSEGTPVSEEALDTVRVSKLCIQGAMSQSMHIDNSNSFYFLMYSSYEYEDGVFKILPDSLLDINMNMYYWSAKDSSFGTFPILTYPFASTIEQYDNEVFIEKRSKENIGSIEISYHRISQDYVDLSEEFIAYSRSLKNTGIMNQSSSNSSYSLPVYHSFEEVSRH